MHYRFFPDDTIFDSEEKLKEVLDDENYIGTVGRAIKKLSKKDMPLFLMAKAFLNEVANVEDIRPYEKSGLISKLPNLKEKIYEMRIPPTRKDGVFRIYFCFSFDPTKENLLVLLDAELKHEKVPSQLDNAKKNYRIARKNNL